MVIITGEKCPEIQQWYGWNEEKSHLGTALVVKWKGKIFWILTLEKLSKTHWRERKSPPSWPVLQTKITSALAGDHSDFHHTRCGQQPVILLEDRNWLHLATQHPVKGKGSESLDFSRHQSLHKQILYELKDVPFHLLPSEIITFTRLLHSPNLCNYANFCICGGILNY